MTTMAGKPRRQSALCAALDEAVRLLDANPLGAETRVLEILRQTPGQAQALRLFATARAKTGGVAEATNALEAFAEETPGIAAVHYELGIVLLLMAEATKAIEAFSRALELEPLHPEARRALGKATASAGLTADGGALANAEEFESGFANLRMMESAALSADDQLARAEALLRDWLIIHPTDVSALHLLGSVYIRLRRFEDAERRLSEAVDLAPDFLDAGWMLAGTYFHRGHWQSTLVHAARLVEKDPDNAEYSDLKAFALMHLGEFDAAIACYENALSRRPGAELWKSYGHALKAVGRQVDAVAAYRKAIALEPSYGLAWWCLADLKTFRFSPSEIEAMKTALEQPGLTTQNRARFHFALGKAFEDERLYDLSFAEFAKANAALRPAGRYSATERTQFVARCKSVCTSRFFEERADWGCAARDPIFIVGLPRSGTTLIEQILASHSQVEATIELQVLESVARRLSLDASRVDKRYPEALRQVTAAEIRSAADEYLATSRVHRKRGCAYFIDKMPNNFNYLGLILLMLPRAKIIDVRRHPLGSGLAIFKHYFAQAYTFAFDLADIGSYYRSYVELMAHFDAVAPGRIHRIFYEQLVADTEQEVRKLFDYCGLTFEEQCLRFYESRRAVLTPSSEQVRSPIFSGATELWRNYEPWLGTLKSVLGDVLQTYPDVPDFSEAAPDVQRRISSTRSGAAFGQSLSVKFKGR